MDEANSFGRRLEELRVQFGKTQAELAEQAGLTKDAVSRLERGQRSPTWGTVVALATALGISTEEFRQPPTGAAPKGRGRPPKKENADRPAVTAKAKGKRGKVK